MCTRRTAALAAGDRASNAAPRAEAPPAQRAEWSRARRLAGAAAALGDRQRRHEEQDEDDEIFRAS
jgi:hypothetical protein